MYTGSNRFILFAAGLLLMGCANQTMPTGGKRDVVPPKLVRVTPPDSLRNTRPSKIEFVFDEYITVTDAMKEVQISPLLEINPVVVSANKKVTIKLPDTLLEENTTYRISLGNAVKDLHEGNVFANYSYMFSTGPNFDSLSLGGQIINAATGLPDSTGISVVLYYSADSDSALVKHKPKYLTRVGPDGNFIFKGLPARKFRIFALRDKNDNLMYDSNGEGVAFTDKLVQPGDSSGITVLRIFEVPDTSTQPKNNVPAGEFRRGAKKAEEVQPRSQTYTVNIDTNLSKRTFGLEDSVYIVFPAKALINKDKITLLKDTGTLQSAVPFTLIQKESSQEKVKISTDWQANSVYSLRLTKGFAKDTSGSDYLPARYTFRTKEDDDYGKINIHLPEKYITPDHILLILRDQDTVYKKTVSESNIQLLRLKPASYTLRLIIDQNHNGVWDAGDLLEKRQPEVVIPYTGGAVILKAGWENNIDFEQKSKSGRLSDRGDGKG